MSLNVCDICHDKPCVYNFTCCRWKCCSMECYGIHKKTPMNACDGKPKDGLADCGGPRHLTACERRDLRLNKKQKVGNGSFIKEDTLLDASILTDEKKKALGFPTYYCTTYLTFFFVCFRKQSSIKKMV
jgi:hypothetical protein